MKQLQAPEIPDVAISRSAPRKNLGKTPSLVAIVNGTIGSLRICVRGDFSKFLGSKYMLPGQKKTSFSRNFLNAAKMGS